MSDPFLSSLLGGTYRVVRLLGRGGMGAVYEARHEGLDRIVALKVLAPEISRHPESMARFQREAIAAARLGHPNIVNVTDYRAQDGEPAFLVMEYLRGKSLEEVITREGSLSAARVGFLAHQTLSALAAAHAAGIVHRDIKPANLFLTANADGAEIAKVLDFGVAKNFSDSALTRAGTLVGSPLYMAPEQAFSTSIDGRADLYALGATMYHALTGRVPLDADNLPHLLMMLKERAPAPVRALAPAVDADLAEVVDRALRKQPAQRFVSADAMREAIARFGGAGARVARGNAPPEVGPRRSGSRPHESSSPALASTPGPMAYSAGGVNQGSRPNAHDNRASYTGPNEQGSRGSFPGGGLVAGHPAQGRYIPHAHSGSSLLWLWIVLGVMAVAGVGSCGLLLLAGVITQQTDERSAHSTEPSRTTAITVPSSSASAEEDSDDEDELRERQPDSKATATPAPVDAGTRGVADPKMPLAPSSARSPKF